MQCVHGNVAALDVTPWLMAEGAASARELHQQLAGLADIDDDRVGCGSGNGGGVCVVASLTHKIEVRPSLYDDLADLTAYFKLSKLAITLCLDSGCVVTITSECSARNRFCQTSKGQP